MPSTDNKNALASEPTRRNAVAGVRATLGGHEHCKFSRDVGERCEAECEQEAIYHEDEVPEELASATQKNIDFFASGPGKDLV